MAIALSITLIIFFNIIALYVISQLLWGWDNDWSLSSELKGILILSNINDMLKLSTLKCHHWLQHKKLYDAYNSYHV